MSLAPVPPLDDSSLSVSVDVARGRVWLAGEFDHASAHLLVDALPVLATAPGDTWGIDAAEVTFCDGGGLPPSSGPGTPPTPAAAGCGSSGPARASGGSST